MSSIFEISRKYAGKIDFLDLDLLIASTIGKPREFVLAHPEYKLTRNQELSIKNNANRRAKGEPLAYILDHKEFFGLNFKVDKHVLIPRPETEMIVEEVLKLKPRNKTIIDIGTGSGNIIITLAKNTKLKNKFIGIDISDKALHIAKQNAKKHKINKKIKFLKGNLLEPALEKNKLHDAIIVANLPYLDLGWKNLLKSSDTKGLKYEPHIALYAGKDGLETYRKLARQLKSQKNSIYLFCEIGHIQKKPIQKIFSFAKKVEFLKDLAGKWRIMRTEI